MNEQHQCDKCSQVFNGRLLEIRVQNNNQSHHWIVQEPSCPDQDSAEPGKCHITWDELSQRLESPSSTSYTIDAKPIRPDVKILLHHTFAGLLASAESGCMSCRLLVEYQKASNPKIEDRPIDGVRGIPVIGGRSGLSQYPNGPDGHFRLPLQLRLWFLGDGDKVGFHWPGKSSSLLRLDLVGPRLRPETEVVGSFQKPTLEKLARWLASCADHDRCNSLSRIYKDIFPGMPSRLLQIINREGQQQVRLREINAIDADVSQLRYTTLSHCWGGKTPSHTLLENNHDHLRSGVSWSSLPRTFRDALEVSWALGFENIWIDALGIFQDSREDWIREAPRMGSVYANAALNIAATAAEDSMGGLFVQAETTARKDVEIRWNNTDFNGDWYLMRVGAPADPDSWHGGTIQPYRPLDTRAWVLQERTFSVKLVEFDRDQIRWGCHSHTATDLEINYEHGIQTRAATDIAIRSGDWPSLVTGYVKRHLTFESERLVAFSGIAQAFARVQHLEESDYMAGLWRQNIREELLWFVQTPIVPPGNSEVPSWSWASLPNLEPKNFMFKNERWWLEEKMNLKFRWFGPEEWGEENPKEGPRWQENFTAAAAPPPSPGDNFSGIAKSAHLKAQCLIYPIKLEQQQEKPDRVVCVVDGDEELNAIYRADFVNEVRDTSATSIYLVPLALYLDYGDAKNGYCKCIDGLVLSSSPNDKCTFRRVGVLQIKDLETVPAWWNPGSHYSMSSDLGKQEGPLRHITII